MTKQLKRRLWTIVDNDGPVGKPPVKWPVLQHELDRFGGRELWIAAEELEGISTYKEKHDRIIECFEAAFCQHGGDGAGDPVVLVYDPFYFVHTLHIVQLPSEDATLEFLAMCARTRANVAKWGITDPMLHEQPRPALRLEAA